MKFQFGFKGFRWPHVDVCVGEFSVRLLKFRWAALLVDL